MDGKDVVAMARTGSGKTAAFLIPMFERLKQHETTGARALIMSPTRELALQTLKFTKDVSVYEIPGKDKVGGKGGGELWHSGGWWWHAGYRFIKAFRR